MVKIPPHYRDLDKPIMVGIMDKIEKGELKYDQSLTYKDSLLYAGEDILGSFKNDEKIALKKVTCGLYQIGLFWLPN